MEITYDSIEAKAREYFSQNLDYATAKRQLARYAKQDKDFRIGFATCPWDFWDTINSNLQKAGFCDPERAGTAEIIFGLINK